MRDKGIQGASLLEKLAATVGFVRLNLVEGLRLLEVEMYRALRGGDCQDEG